MIRSLPISGAVSEIEDLSVELDRRDVWASLGSRDRTVASLEDEVSRQIEHGCELCEPRGLLARLEVAQVGRGGVSFVGGRELEGKFLAHCFEGAGEAIFLVVTIGPALEAQVARLFAEGNDLEAMVVDAVGTASITSAFNRVTSWLCEQAADSGRQAGMVLGPGQSYWDITGQRTIFQVVPASRIGLELTDSCFMVPQKSHSGVIPLGTHLKVRNDPSVSFCRYCPAKRCPMRQEPPSP